MLKLMTMNDIHEINYTTVVLFIGVSLIFYRGN